MSDSLKRFTQMGIETLSAEDPTLFDLLEKEFDRQASVLNLVAAASVADPSVLIAESMVTTNVTTEGFPGARFHAGCEIVDEIENLAIERAKKAFKARYANVQPHSGTSANQIVIFSVLRPGDTILGLELNSGGHLTHGSKASSSGQYFNAVGYGLDVDGLIDYQQVEQLALEHKPKLIICGASAYPRIIDFERFRQISDQAGALLMADISHIAGLVAAGVHPSPIDQAHFTTTSTYKQLYGPRGGMILMGKDHDSPSINGKKSLSDMIQRATFPFFQGTPNLSAIAAKARALDLIERPEFRELAQRIIDNAQVLARIFVDKGYKVLTGGTDNHMILMDVFSNGTTGIVAERALEECGIITNKNRIPGDTKSAMIASGMRLGTNTVALLGMGMQEMQICAELVDRVLSSISVLGDKEYSIDDDIRSSVISEVRSLRRKFPIPRYQM